jgi:hypothetical protein
MKSLLQRYLPSIALLLAFLCGFMACSYAAPLTIINSGFEDTSGQTVFNEFTFGTPAEAGPPDLEVDFDNVRLDAETIVLSEPGTAMLLGLGLVGLARCRRKNRI